MTLAPERIGSPLPVESLESLKLDRSRLEMMERLIERHIADGRYPGAQVAMARHGRIAYARTFGNAALPNTAATDSTLWLLFSQTKVLTAATAWTLVDQGVLRFADRIADHMPEFAANGKGEVTLFDVLTHQGGFPSATVPDAAWTDHAHLRQAVCNFTLEWTPRSRVLYHPGAAHWVVVAVIEAVTGRDFRDVIRDNLLGPLGLDQHIIVGVPESEQARCADMHASENGTMVPAQDRNTTAFRAAGVPGGGGYATAVGMVALYQAFLAGGALNGNRALSQRVITFATRNHTADRVDESFGMPMHRGLGPHVRGVTPTIRGLGTIASPGTFGHGGAGSSYSWADPDSGVSFTYLTNARADEPWHTIRLDQISNLAHAAIQ